MNSVEKLILVFIRERLLKLHIKTLIKLTLDEHKKLLDKDFHVNDSNEVEYIYNQLYERKFQ